MSEPRNGADLIVVGGGVIGLAVAREARARGMQVMVLEARRAGREASWAAAGMLSPLGEALDPGSFLGFAVESLRAWAAFAEGLEEEVGIPLEYREAGKVRVAESPAEEERLRARLARAAEHGVAARWMTSAELREAEPGIGHDVRGGLLLEEDFRVDNRALGEALVESVRARGVDLREGVRVRGIAERGERVRSVRLASGAELRADAVLLAAGAWTGRLDGLPQSVPVKPIRGQMLSLRPADWPTGRVLESGGAYLVPRDDGRLLVGATQEDVGFRRGTTAGGLRSLLDAAVRLAPALASAPVSEIWDGFRPGTPDGLPILGPYPGVDGVYVATGHFRNGILLAPLTGRLMGALVGGEPAPALPADFAPARFTAAPPHRVPR